MFTWFDRANPPEMHLDLLPVAYYYEHNMKDHSVRRSRVGKVTKAWVDDTGIGYEAELDPTSPRYWDTVQLIKSGKGYTSSGSAERFARWRSDGSFEDWPLNDVTATANPCETRMPSVKVVRSDTGIELVRETLPTDALRTHEPTSNAIATRSAGKDTSPNCSCGSAHRPQSQSAKRGNLMTLEELGFGPEMTTSQIGQSLVDQFGRELVAGIYDGVFAVEGAPLDSVDQLVANAQSAYADQDPATVQVVVEVIAAVIAERPEEIGELVAALSAPAEEPAMEAAAPVADPAAMSQRQRPALPRLPVPQPVRNVPLDAGTLNRRIAQLETQVRRMATSTQGLSAPLPRTTKKGNEAVRSANVTQVIDRKYDRYNAAQLALGYILLTQGAVRGMGTLPSESYVRALSHKVARELSAQNERAQWYRDRFANDYEQSVRSMNADTLFSVVRANELVSATNNATWVGEFWSDMLWEKIRTRRVYDVLRAAGMEEEEVPQGSNVFHILSEGTGVTISYSGESISATSSTGIPSATAPLSSPSMTLRDIPVSKLTARSIVTGELSEDAVIPFLSYIVQNQEKEMLAAIEAVLCFGDTETGGTGNINSDDGALTGTSQFLSMNGFAKLAIVTNTANKRDIGGAPTLGDFNKTAKLMGVNALDPTKVAYIVDADTYYLAREFDQVETVEKFGDGATVHTGVLSSLYGSPILPSDQMGLAEADGKISTVTPANNVKGRILAVAAPRWKVGWKRRMTPEVQRWSGADATEFVMHARFGLAYADTDAAAISYNGTV